MLITTVITYDTRAVLCARFTFSFVILTSFVQRVLSYIRKRKPTKYLAPYYFHSCDDCPIFRTLIATQRIRYSCSSIPPILHFSFMICTQYRRGETFLSKLKAQSRKNKYFKKIYTLFKKKEK